MLTPPNPFEPSQPLDDPTPKTKLYVHERADSARNQAIGILGFVALILSIGTGLGAFASARNYIKQEINNLHLEELRYRAEVAVAHAESDAKKINEILQKSGTVEARLTALTESAAADELARKERIAILQKGISDNEAFLKNSKGKPEQAIGDHAHELEAQRKELEGLRKRDRKQ